MAGGVPTLETRGLAKAYGSVVAVDSIDLSISAGEVLAIVGDNGAGKSTLLKMLCGALEPDAGEILYNGSPVKLESPHHARSLGIETVWQDLALDSGLDIAGNIYMGRELVHGQFGPRMLRLLNRKGMARGAAERLHPLRITVPPVTGVPADRLSGGERQAVAVARAAAWAGSVLLMDEPTAALGVKQSGAVLALARRIAELGKSVVMITHTIAHVMEFADKVAVLRHGRCVADLRCDEVTPESLVALIVGFDSGAPTSVPNR
jgi:fructose transport system ATP-binding protein